MDKTLAIFLIMFFGWFLGIVTAILLAFGDNYPYCIWWKITHLKEYLYGYSIRKSEKAGEYEVYWV